MKGDARSAGGMRLSTRHRRAHALIEDPTRFTQREARDMFRKIREKEQSKGIFRRWNDRQLTPAEQKRATKAQKKPGEARSAVGPAKARHKPRKRPRRSD